MLLGDEQVDVRSDEYQKQKMEECLDMLIAAGYFRARIKGLSDFDKIIGGLVWCIQLCRLEVNVGLFYKESLSIGKKIALTERIIEVLRTMGCPYNIEPHQIQGSDAVNLFPVVQWLVRTGLENQSEIVSDNLRYGEFLFHQWNPSVVKRSTYCVDLNEKIRSIINDFKNRNVCEGMEKILCISSLDVTQPGEELSGSSIIPLSDAKKSDTSSDISEKIQKLQHSQENVERRMNLLAEEYKKLQTVAEEKKASRLALENELESLQKKVSDAKSNLDEDEIQNLRRIKETLEEADKINREDQIFKEEAKLENEKLISELDELSEKNSCESSSETETLTEEIKRLKSDLSELENRVEELLLTSDDVPERAEVIQYQKGFVELSDAILSTLNETKTTYAAINLLTDTLSYLKREQNVVNSIIDQYDVAKQSAKTRDQFMDQVSAILVSMGSNKTEIARRLFEQQEQLEKNQATLNKLRTLARNYRSSLHRFRDECTRNRDLTSMLAEEQQKDR